MDEYIFFILWGIILALFAMRYLIMFLAKCEYEKLRKVIIKRGGELLIGTEIITATEDGIYRQRYIGMKDIDVRKIIKLHIKNNGKDVK